MDRFAKNIDAACHRKDITGGAAAGVLPHTSCSTKNRTLWRTWGLIVLTHICYGLLSKITVRFDSILLHALEVIMRQAILQAHSTHTDQYIPTKSHYRQNQIHATRTIKHRHQLKQNICVHRHNVAFNGKSQHALFSKPYTCTRVSATSMLFHCCASPLSALAAGTSARSATSAIA